MLNENLKKLRLENGYTMEDIAKELNLSIAAISLYEKGKREPNQETLIKIADFYGITVDDLLGRGKKIASPDLKAEVKRKFLKAIDAENRTPEELDHIAELIKLADKLAKEVIKNQ